MERLTKRELVEPKIGKKIVGCNYKDEDCNDSCLVHVSCRWNDKALEKLKEYEDLEEKGMLIRLPVAIGDTVYAITSCKDFEKVLDGTLWDAGGGFGTATGYYCPYELNDSCPHEDDFEECECGCKCFEDKLAVFEDCVEGSGVYEDNVYVYLQNCGCFSFEDFGKTVFLTREEAEAALERMNKGK